MAETTMRSVLCPDLTEYELRLCEYAIGGVRGYRGEPEFIQEIAPGLRRTRRTRLHELIYGADALDALRACPITERELADLYQALDSPPTGTNWRWRPYEAIHRNYLDTVPEVRRRGTPGVLEHWTVECPRFGDRLSQDGLPLAEGLDTVRDRIRILRQLVRSCEEQPRRSPPEPTETPLDPQKMNRIEAMVQSLREQSSVKDWYSVAKLAVLLGKAEFTVREWCLLGRIRAEKWAGVAAPTPLGS